MTDSNANAWVTSTHAPMSFPEFVVIVGAIMARSSGISFCCPPTNQRMASLIEWGRPASWNTDSPDFDLSERWMCPLWPGRPVSAHWGVPDPAAVGGSEERRRKAFMDAALTLRRRIELFLSLPLQSLDALSLQRELRDIGNR